MSSGRGGFGATPAPASVKVAQVGGCSGPSANPLAREAPFQLLDAQAMGRHRLRVSTVCDVVARQKDGVEHAAQR